MCVDFTLVRLVVCMISRAAGPHSVCIVVYIYEYAVRTESTWVRKQLLHAPVSKQKCTADRIFSRDGSNTVENIGASKMIYKNNLNLHKHIFTQGNALKHVKRQWQRTKHYNMIYITHFLEPGEIKLSHFAATEFDCFPLRSLVVLLCM